MTINSAHSGISFRSVSASIFINVQRIDFGNAGGSRAVTGVALPEHPALD